MKKLLLLFMLTFFVGCASVELTQEPVITPVISEQRMSDINKKNAKLIKFMLSDTKEFYLNKSDFYYLGKKMIRLTMYHKQNLSKHDYFDWRWNIRFATLFFVIHEFCSFGL